MGAGMKFLGLSFSHARNSLQSRGLSLVDRFLQFDQRLSLADFNIPICDSNRPDGVVLDSVARLDRAFEEADALVFAVPEAGGHYSAAFKNILDWLIVKHKFNSQLGKNYSLSGKPVYILTFTPTVPGSGGRHFEMTRSILTEKFGAVVRRSIVFNKCWEHVLPENFDFVKTSSFDILEDAKLFLATSSKPEGTARSVYDVEKWMAQYKRWDDQWTAF